MLQHNVVSLQQNYKKKCNLKHKPRLKLKRLQTSLLFLPENLRNELKTPLGKLIENNSSEKENYIRKIYSEKVIITVGDATSELLLQMGLIPLLHIIDGQEKREKRSLPFSDTINTELTVKNNPGEISTESL